VALLAVGCSASVSAQTPAATHTLRPYLALTATSTVTLPPKPPISEATPRPSATLFTHTIQKDETLLVVAARYGVSLEMLLAANPGINPRLLSIGQQLTIPGPEGGQLIPELPTTTPFPVQISGVACYPTRTEGQMCLATVSNPGQAALEGVVVQFTLLGSTGQPESMAQANTPINLLRPGQIVPVWASFAIPWEGPNFIQATLLSAIQAAHPEERYPEVGLTERIRESLAGKTLWTVSGEAEIAASSDVEVRRLVVLAIGFASSGAIVGFAEAEIEPGASSVGPIPYMLHVFSLGPPIEDVRVVAEASTSD